MYKLFEEAGIPVTGHQKEQFAAFTSLLLEWNQKINLTAITQPEEIVVKHYLDSALLLKSGVVENEMRAIDVGCGAGFPSIPVKILRPDLQFTLLDALNKRLLFLNRVIEELGLAGIDTLHMRAEDAGQMPEYRQKFDLCVARAVAPLNVLMEYCTPFLSRDGYFVALKGPGGYQELEDARNAIRLLQMELVKTVDLELPQTGQKRLLIVLKKVGDTPATYPRKAGKPAKKPL